MHELFATEQIKEIVLRHAEAAEAARVTDVFLVVGELSSMVDDAVQFYWDAISADTAAEGAHLHFRRVPAEMRCRQCGRRYSLREDLLCPACESGDVELVAGEGFYVESIGVEAERSSAREIRD
ncbi:MAG TPA: hydrogenase maturation nickel metallochaperone HypA [Candidatus Sulfomarinibacteraceae bacterium]|nr:hydrogenase maturation nickel metallochaperone HypA [Candidatus Sulfomarinibacteraceae bacterium]